MHAILDAAAARVEELLAAAAAADAPLSFAFIMPGWKETRAHASLSASPFLRRAVLVAAADHGFCDGASRRPRPAAR